MSRQAGFGGLLAVLVLSGVCALAQEITPMETRAREIAPFVDGQTLGVVRVELGKLDLDDVEKWMQDLIGRAWQDDPAGAHRETQRASADFQTARTWLTGMSKAGAKRLYVLVDQRGPAPEGMVVVVPLPGGSDADAMAALLMPEMPAALAQVEPAARARYMPRVVKLHNALVLARDEALQRLNNAVAVARPELAEAMAVADDAAVQVVFMPNAELQGKIELMMPAAPPELGGWETKRLTQAVKWAVLGLNPPPNLSARLVIRSHNGPQANGLLLTLGTLLDAAAKHPAMQREVPEAAKYRGMLQPVVADDQLVVTLDARQAGELASNVLGPAVRRARERASLAHSASNIRQILMGCVTYASRNRDEWPENLQVLLEHGIIPPEVLTNPRQPQQPAGYTYVPPAKAAVNRAALVTVYETYQAWPGSINVGFADGHVEVGVDEAHFKEMLKKSGVESPK